MMHIESEEWSCGWVLLEAVAGHPSARVKLVWSGHLRLGHDRDKLAGESCVSERAGSVVLVDREPGPALRRREWRGDLRLIR